ncbi:uncharacterized protein MKZ38_002061 [Zalerion maritima]|uniref:Peptide hydrolase n=1 Tax=Zalerion maritima TaxID=339359 RepID=A0AAD5RYK1_9PEZI|nr:uncharacterized protein MKZ38_002061 [Zalerion maritima]
MKASVIAALLLSSGASARFIESHETADNAILFPEDAYARYHIELAPGETRWVTEEEKWELRREGKKFMDITSHPSLGSRASTASTVQFPSKVAHSKFVEPLLSSLSKKKMQTHLEKFTSFHTRYYKSQYGAQSSAWLQSQVEATVSDAGLSDLIDVRPFEHPWGQNSIVARIPGEKNSTVVIGAHQDSINLWIPSILAAPGADDDGSGTVTILEALRVLLTSDIFKDGGKPENTVEFHWYSAEEGGLLGSQAIFAHYEKEGRDVKAMLQQDMTGFVKKTLDAGKPESVGVITDYVDVGLTDFIKKVITEYCDIPFVETKCGYACSDHASASKAGYPSAFVIESAFEDSSDHIHSAGDVISTLSFDHMLQHAKLTLGLAYELASADFKGKSDDGGYEEASFSEL